MYTSCLPLPTQAKKDCGHFSPPFASSDFLFLSPGYNCLLLCQGKSRYRCLEHTRPRAELASWNHPLCNVALSSLVSTEGYMSSTHNDTLWFRDHVNYNIRMCSQILQNGESVKNCVCKLSRYIEKSYTDKALVFCRQIKRGGRLQPH